MDYFLTIVLTLIFSVNFALAVFAAGFSLKIARALMQSQGETNINPENTVSKFDVFYKRIMK